MELFHSLIKYDAIYVHWCINYLTKEKAIAFLKEAKNSLRRDTAGKNEKAVSDSYIFLLDNVRR